MSRATTRPPGVRAAFQHHATTGTVAPRKPTSSRAPADRKALACSPLSNGKDLLPNVGGATAQDGHTTRLRIR
jgi:hypothetical protein